MQPKFSQLRPHNHFTPDGDHVFNIELQCTVIFAANIQPEFYFVKFALPEASSLTGISKKMIITFIKIQYKLYHI